MNLMCFPRDVQALLIFKSWTLQRMSHMTKHTSKVGEVDPGDRVTLLLG